MLYIYRKKDIFLLKLCCGPLNMIAEVVSTTLIYTKLILSQNGHYNFALASFVKAK